MLRRGVAAARGPLLASGAWAPGAVAGCTPSCRSSPWFHHARGMTSDGAAMGSAEAGTAPTEPQEAAAGAAGAVPGEAGPSASPRRTASKAAPPPEISYEQAMALVDRFLSDDLADGHTQGQRGRQEAASPWRAHDGDTGSPAVQIAQWTAKIQRLQEHVCRVPQDKKAKMAMQMIGAKRHKMMKYLRRKDYEMYFRVTAQLGLRDTQPRVWPQRYRFNISQVLDVQEGLEALHIIDKSKGQAGFWLPDKPDAGKAPVAGERR